MIKLEKVENAILYILSFLVAAVVGFFINCIADSIKTTRLNTERLDKIECVIDEIKAESRENKEKINNVFFDEGG